VLRIGDPATWPLAWADSSARRAPGPGVWRGPHALLGYGAEMAQPGIRSAGSDIRSVAIWT